ncbi:hypothetical protein AN958_08623 [Leucoagaricus sp. SymC.cos]|nr:hypothetical protein AN958_08623 [Leucoagaricus sp. SymC.cos]
MAEARLAQSLRRCKNEPSIHELKLRTLQQATRMLGQFAEGSAQQAKQLASMTTSRASVADLDPESYRSLLSQRWKAQRQQDFISQNMEMVQQTITSLTTTPYDAGNPLSIDGHEDQVPGPKERANANLVSFLCCPQRVAPLHHRSRSRLLKLYLRPLYLDPSITAPTPATPTSTTFIKSSITDSSSDASLDMHVQTPVVTNSLAEQQAQFTINEEAGTAIILTQPLPKPAPLDPSDVKVELPDYVHELLADFDAQGHTIPSAETVVKFQADNTPSTETGTRKRGLWPFRSRSRARGLRNAASQPDLRSKSSLKRFSGLLSAPEMLTSRKKVIPKRTGSKTTLTSASESESRDEVDGHSPTRRPTSPDRMIGKMAYRVLRRISSTTTGG